LDKEPIFPLLIQVYLEILGAYRIYDDIGFFFIPHGANTDYMSIHPWPHSWKHLPITMTGKTNRQRNWIKRTCTCRLKNFARSKLLWQTLLRRVASKRYNMVKGCHGWRTFNFWLNLWKWLMWVLTLEKLCEGIQVKIAVRRNGIMQKIWQGHAILKYLKAWDRLLKSTDFKSYSPAGSMCCSGPYPTPRRSPLKDAAIDHVWSR